MSNCLDPDQARHLVGPDLGPKCLEKLSADDTSRQKFDLFISGDKESRCQEPVNRQ